MVRTLDFKSARGDLRVQAHSQSAGADPPNCPACWCQIFRAPLQLGGAHAFASLSFCWRVQSTTFFDDFPTIGTDTERVQLTSCVEAAFSVAEWSLKDTDSFPPSFSALGVQVDLGEFDAGKVAFGNTDIRFSGLKEAIGKVLAQGSIEPHVARKLRGRFSSPGPTSSVALGAGARHLGNVADAIDLSTTSVQSALSGLRELCSLVEKSSFKTGATDAPTFVPAVHGRCVRGRSWFDWRRHL